MTKKYLGDQAAAVGAPTPRPAFCTIDTWTQLSGMSRRSTYEALGRGDLKGVKRGSQTLINFDAGLAWLRSLPAVRIKVPKARKPEEAAAG